MAHTRTSARARLWAVLLVALAAAGTALADPPAATAAVAAEQPRGHDVSSHQRAVDWEAAKAAGATFVYVKATESTAYRNPYFGPQFDGAGAAGLVRGAYHFARPDQGPGEAQAAFFVHNGGGWSADGRTLPPALDVEYNPYDARRPCYGLSRAGTVAWIRAFSDEVNRLTGRRPVIYTTTHWWNACTGGSGAFAADHALWIARHGSADAGTLPAGWSSWTFWQYADRGGLPGDQNLFNGSAGQLARFARGA
ncbi:lysozyme [Streptomyces sp. NBC_01275]|uniref:lysozyme n=1 Tax=Streptomyces sp. NBC_01275 TaxID=2903807 RepID=UPI00225A3654|nr:lysozyme [Streptomyces sp. NBC_01275]MCX4761033.1 lysozyme [Streptomyces sp. NBC_01275]